MHAAFSALLKAVSDLREPRVLALGLVPPLAAIVVWIALGCGGAASLTRACPG